MFRGSFLEEKASELALREKCGFHVWRQVGVGVEGSPGRGRGCSKAERQHAARCGRDWRAPWSGWSRLVSGSGGRRDLKGGQAPDDSDLEQPASAPRLLGQHLWHSHT